MEITHFVNLFADTLAQMKYNLKVKTEFEKNRVQYERTKMEADVRKEVEEKEKEEFIKQWIKKQKEKGKKKPKKVDKNPTLKKI